MWVPPVITTRSGCGLAGGPAAPMGTSQETCLALPRPLSVVLAQLPGLQPACHTSPGHCPRCPDHRQDRLPRPGPAESRLGISRTRGPGISRTRGCVRPWKGDTQSNAWWVGTARPGTPTQRRSDGSVQQLPLAPRWACAAPHTRSMRPRLQGPLQGRGWTTEESGAGEGRAGVVVPPRTPGRGTVTAGTAKPAH